MSWDASEAMAVVTSGLTVGAVGAVVGLVADKKHVKRDALIGAAVGMVTTTIWAIGIDRGNWNAASASRVQINPQLNPRR